MHDLMKKECKENSSNNMLAIIHGNLPCIDK